MKFSLEISLGNNNNNDKKFLDKLSPFVRPCGGQYHNKFHLEIALTQKPLCL